nr:VOC family protein [Devosia enhydra]
MSDIERARGFYGEVLGLESETGTMPGVLVYRTGSTRLVIYSSDVAGTNRANAVVWDCGEDIEAIAAALAARGVTFERYEMEGVRFRDGVHDAGGFRMVWFKDPDGNILHLTSA